MSVAGDTDGVPGSRAQALGLGVCRPAALGRPTSRRRPPTSATGSASAATARGAGAARRRSSCAAPRLEPPPSLAAIVARRPPRARHATRSARPTATSCAASAAQFDNPPDVVARPRDEAEVEAVLDWCARRGRRGDPLRRRHQRRRRRRAADRRRATPARSRSTSARSTGCSRSTRSRARRGSRPARSARRSRTSSREHGLTLRHFPQSFEFSTLGGWIATRAGGHFATVLHPHRRPGRVGAGDHARRARGRAGGCRARAPGPSPDRMLLGSEGILGVITEAWVRVQERPDAQALGRRRVRRRSRPAPRRCARSRSRASTPPTAACSTRPRRRSPHARPDGKALLVLGLRVGRTTRSTRSMDRALERRARSRRRGPERAAAARPAADGDEATPSARGATPSSRAPVPARHARRAAACSRDTFETAITWDRFEEFHATVIETARRRSPRPAARRRRPGRAGHRAASPTSTPTARRPTSRSSRRRGAAARSSSGTRSRRRSRRRVIAAGGTITHHHAVGRDHRPWYDRQRPEPFAEALRAAKRAVDPARRSSTPGVLIDP